MKDDQTLRAPITNSWLVNIKNDKNMQDDYSLKFVKPSRLGLLYNCAGRNYKITA